MINLTDLKSFNLFIGADQLNYVEDDSGTQYQFIFSDRTSFECFVPRTNMIYSKEYILTYRVHKLLTDLHTSILKKNSLLLLKNFHKSEDLLIFDHEKGTYHYTSFKDLHDPNDTNSDTIRNWIIDLNLSLNKLGYKLS